MIDAAKCAKKDSASPVTTMTFIASPELIFGMRAVKDFALGADCVAHARTFFSRPDFDLKSAEPGTFKLVPTGEMKERLKRDYENMQAMIFGAAPRGDGVIASLEELQHALNSR